MKLYLVRHGETTDNTERRYQTKDSCLSLLGKKQAHILAKRLQNIDIDYIYCSPQKRAQETGLIINNTLKKQVEFTPLLSEFKRPSELEGKLKDGSEIKKLSQMLKDNFHNPSWRHSDEETFFDIRKRALACIEMVKSSQKENVLVVSHNLFISAIVSVLMFGEKVTSYELSQWMYFAVMENTGISVCQYSQDKGWRLMAWNDHTHFGELR
ncbi:MAG: histidine phosphatase family protein [bacterium]